MRIRTAPAGVAAASGALLLAACGPSAPAAKPAVPSASSTHPVFSKPLDARPYAALGQTKAAKNAMFTQTVTFSAKGADAVLKTTGKLDFADGRADGSLGWTVGEGFPEGAAKALGNVDLHRRKTDRAARLVIDRQNVNYRSATADYWLRYTGTTPLTGDPYGYAALAANAWRGNQAPFNGSLLEILAATGEAKEEALPDGGRRYRTELVGQSVRDFLKSIVPAGGLADAVNAVRYPLTMTVDRDGRVTSAETDVSAAVAKGEQSEIAGVQGLRIKLTLDGYGTSAPGAVPAADKVLPAADAIVQLRGTKAGACVDFGTGLTDRSLVVKADCGDAHDGRILARPGLQDDGYPGSAALKRRADAECTTAFRNAPSAWAGENVDEGAFWYTWPSEDNWKRDTQHAATCYVLSR
ncbi:hypothetical protein ACFPFX_06640 [Streptomyces mauvecolor]|uniref:Septum formation-related domain-containing protein n=1 Tax=Streptomyces mauvecolor TaxID=58345 RepID=A0ABV9UHV4_9ACTN